MLGKGNGKGATHGSVSWYDLVMGWEGAPFVTESSGAMLGQGSHTQLQAGCSPPTEERREHSLLLLSAGEL